MISFNQNIFKFIILKFIPFKTLNSSPSTSSEKKSIIFGALILFKIEFKFSVFTLMLTLDLILSFVDLVLRVSFKSSFK